MIDIKKVQEKSITQLVIDLISINENMMNIKKSNPIENYDRCIHYVAMNYDIHLIELRRRGQHTIADAYTEKCKEWRQ